MRQSLIPHTDHILAPLDKLPHNRYYMLVAIPWVRSVINYYTFRYEGVRVLQIFDATGEIVHYVGGVSSDLYPHFIGPGRVHSW